MLIDSHAHINLPTFDRDREQVFARAKQGGVRAIINIGMDVASSRASLKLAKKYDDVFSTVGFHPHEASELKDEDLETLAELAKDKRVVAVGEMGLDFYRNLSPRPSQIEAFKKQLDLAVELQLPVVVHCRQAHGEVYDILSDWVKANPADNRRGVIHCFSGDIDMARRYIELGFYISLAGSVTYPSAEELVGVARELPLERLLLETDAPVVYQRGSVNEFTSSPADVTRSLRGAAALKGVDEAEIAGVTTQNAKELLGIW